MIPKIEINVPTDFGRIPYGRDDDDGDQNGARFRHQKLLPALLNAEKVIVSLDGTDIPYGSSFLEEAFGGLIRLGYFSAEQLRDRVKIISSYDNNHDRIAQYLSDAKFGSTKELRAAFEKRYGVQ